MTTNQIAYFKVKVEQEHYKLSDAEAARHNKSTENIANLQLQETARTNQANEAIKMAQLAETTRHNTVTESQTWASLNIQQATLAETQRHNQAVETETHRSNYTNELIKASQNAIQRELNESVIASNTAKTISQQLQNEFDYATQNARIVQTIAAPTNSAKSPLSAVTGAITSLASAVVTRTPTTSVTTTSPISSNAKGIPTSVTNKLNSTVTVNKALTPTQYASFKVVKRY